MFQAVGLIRELLVMKDVRSVLPVSITLYALLLIGAISSVSGIMPLQQVLASDSAAAASASGETAAKGTIGVTQGADAKGKTEHKAFPTVRKDISMSALEKYGSIDISVQDPKAEGDDKKEMKYSGIPLRTILSEMVPDLKLESMPEIKTAAKRELVLEVKGADGYPALIPVADIAINRQGDRFVLATHVDGKLMQSGPQLICKTDQAKTRWVHEVVSLRVVGLRD
jgi:hypothetical protein